MNFRKEELLIDEIKSKIAEYNQKDLQAIARGKEERVKLSEKKNETIVRVKDPDE